MKCYTEWNWDRYKTTDDHVLMINFKHQKWNTDFLNRLFQPVCFIIYAIFPLLRKAPTPQTWSTGQVRWVELSKVRLSRTLSAAAVAYVSKTAIIYKVKTVFYPAPLFTVTWHNHKGICLLPGLNWETVLIRQMCLIIISLNIYNTQFLRKSIFYIRVSTCFFKNYC